MTQATRTSAEEVVVEQCQATHHEWKIQTGSTAHCECYTNGLQSSVPCESDRLCLKDRGRSRIFLGCGKGVQCSPGSCKRLGKGLMEHLLWQSVV